jgi:diguanylate cyclase (GGDEF)-like protein
VSAVGFWSPTAAALVAGALAAIAVPVAAAASGSGWPTAALPLLVGVGVWAWLRTRSVAVKTVALAKARADYVSVIDELTGCSNDAGLRMLGRQLLAAARRRGDALHAFVVDVAQLARVNELAGRDRGDEVLLAVAEAVRAGTRDTEVVARGYSDEFVVLGPGVGVHPGELERRVRAHVIEAPPVALDVWPCRVTVGHAILEPWDSGDVDDVIRRAYQDAQLRAAMRAPSAPEPPISAAP